MILNLTREMGVNLAGIEIILNMREKMAEMQRRWKRSPNSCATKWRAILWPGRRRGRSVNAIVRTAPRHAIRVEK